MHHAVWDATTGAPITAARTHTERSQKRYTPLLQPRSGSHQGFASGKVGQQPILLYLLQHAANVLLLL